MLSGNVDNRGIGHVLAYFLSLGRNGILSLSNDVSEGELHLFDGSIIGARFDKIAGEKALETLLKLSSYSFKFTESDKLSRNLDNIETEMLYQAIEDGLNNRDLLTHDSILIQNKRRIQETKSIDAAKWSILNLIGNGIILSRLKEKFHGQGSDLNKTLKELITGGYVILVPGQPSQDIFLFPKPVRIGLDREETELFWHIIDGITLFELLNKVRSSVESIANLLIRIILKRKLVITDDSGRIHNPWQIYDALSLDIEPKKCKLIIVDSAAMKSGTIGFNEMLLNIWKQQMRGESIAKVSIKSKLDGSKKVFDVTEGNIEQNEVLISVADIEELGYKRNQDVEIMPLKG